MLNGLGKGRTEKVRPHVLRFQRFMSVAFPFFLCAGRLLEGRTKLTYIVVAVFLVLQTIAAKNLMEWRFVG